MTKNNPDELHQQHYVKLVSELAIALQIDPAQLLDTEHLVINGVDVGLMNYGPLDRGRMTVFFDLGPIPAAREGEIHRRLLEQNLQMPSSMGVFAIIPDNGHGALLTHFYFSDELTGEVLAEHIRGASKVYVSLEKSLEQIGSRREMDHGQQKWQRRLMQDKAAKVS